MLEHQYAIIASDFNSDITSKLLHGAQSRLLERGVPVNHITIVNVPGAIEIPLIAQLLAKTNKYSAIICLGCVIRGETSHYDYVCEQVSQGCQKVMLEHEIPVIFGVLTTDDEEQALNRVGGKHGHKGMDAADAAIKMIEVIDSVQ